MRFLLKKIHLWYWSGTVHATEYSGGLKCIVWGTYLMKERFLSRWCSVKVVYQAISHSLTNSPFIVDHIPRNSLGKAGGKHGWYRRVIKFENSASRKEESLIADCGEWPESSGKWWKISSPRLWGGKVLACCIASCTPERSQWLIAISNLEPRTRSCDER